MSSEGELDFDAVYAEHAAFVRRELTRRGVRQADLDDVAQETFVTVHRLLPTFEHRASLTTWLYAVTWRVASAYHRRRLPQRKRSDDDAEALGELSHVDLPGVEHLHDSLGRMQPDDRDLFLLSEVGGLSVAELSELTGSARKTISQRLERSRRALGRIISAPSSPPVAPAEIPAGVTQEAQAPLGHDCPDYCCFTFGDAVIAIWRGQGTSEAMKIVIDIVLAAADQAANGITFLNIIEPTSRPPGLDGREMFGRAAERMQGRLRAGAWVVGGQGLGYMAVPIVNSYLFLTRSQLNIRFFRELPSAVTWLAPYATESKEQILLHCAELTARLDRHAAH